MVSSTKEDESRNSTANVAFRMSFDFAGLLYLILMLLRVAVQAKCNTRETL